MASADAVVEAARALAEAEWVIVATGAGFSADSGLPTYEECRAAGIEYDDLCRAELLYEDPALFIGFWAESLRRYRETPCHEGYDILASLLHDRAEAGRVHVYTSNVDGHFRRFPQMHLFEIHGCCEEWMCSSKVPYAASELARDGSASSMPPHDVPLDGERWRRVREEQQIILRECGSAGGCDKPIFVSAPDGWSVSVDPASMRAHLGNGCRDAPVSTECVDWSHVPPRCPCGLPMRPCVLMFADEDAALLRRLKANGDAYQRWEESMEEHVSAGAPGRQESCGGKLVVFELGCGTRVQSIRQECELVLKDSVAKGAKVTLIRVNPAANPMLDTLQEDVGSEDYKLIRLKMGALEALRGIDGLLRGTDKP